MGSVKSKNKKEWYEKLGFEHPALTLLYAPKRYEDYTHCPIIFPDHHFCDEVEILTLPEPPASGRRSQWQIRALHRTSGIEIIISFFAPHPKASEWRDYAPGQTVLVKGIIKQYGTRFYLNKAKPVSASLLNRIQPVYPPIKGKLSAKDIADRLSEVVSNDFHVHRCASFISAQMGPSAPEIQKISRMLRAMHAPQNMYEAELALQRAKEWTIASIRAFQESERTPNKKSALLVDWFSLQLFKTKLPFRLSPSQEKAIEGIVAELGTPYPSKILLSGDVGSGKTAAYLLPAVASWVSKYNVAILAPNLPLANEIYKSAHALFSDVADIRLITAGSDYKPKQRPALVIGTTALFGWAKKNNFKADLLIIDEQQKYGVRQKKALMHEGTNVVEATATCIPRTMGQALSGGMKIFRLEPHVHKMITTKLLTPSMKGELLQKVREEVSKGNRCLFIYPALNTNKDEMRLNVVAAYEAWEKLFPGDVAMLHGRMKPEEKTETIERMQKGEAHILVSTSLIEVGITIPKLTVAAIIRPDKYGVSTIHQMRGRAGRDGSEAWCYLVLDFEITDDLPKNKREIVERLSALCSTQDGFRLAELDMQARGAGSLISEASQHGKTRDLFRGGVHVSPEEIMATQTEKPL
ncbi:DEAD/DEAH box helicase [Candidatus Parcubacteria bacterium]|nr:MAG: DEAD/DEAH box helicase [Candidatus Parcubacteria bacterium]